MNSSLISNLNSYGYFTKNEIKEFLGNNINQRAPLNNFLAFDFMKYHKLFSATQSIHKRNSFNINNSKLFQRSKMKRKIRYRSKRKYGIYEKSMDKKNLVEDNQMKAIFEFLCENFSNINENQSNTIKKIDYLTDLILNTSKTNNKIENQSFEIINNIKNQDQFDYFSFRLNNLSLNYHLNSIKPNILNSRLNKELGNSDKNLENNSESPNFNKAKEEKITMQMKINDEKISNRNSNPCKNNVFNDNLINANNFDNYRSNQIIYIENDIKRTNTEMISKDIVERRFSVEEEMNTILTDNNNSNFSDIETLKNNFKGDNLNNSSMKENTIERVISEVASSSNFSMQDSNIDSQEKIKKIRGFNFKNNINTKKFNKQQLLGVKDKKNDNFGFHYNSSGSNNNPKKNFINLRSNEDKAVLITNRNDIVLNEKIEESVKMKKYNFNDNLNSKKYGSSSNSLNNSFSQIIDQNNKD